MIQKKRNKDNRLDPLITIITVVKNDKKKLDFLFGPVKKDRILFKFEPKKINLGYQNLNRFDYSLNMKKYYNLIKKHYVDGKII